MAETTLVSSAEQSTVTSMPVELRQNESIGDVDEEAPVIDHHDEADRTEDYAGSFGEELSNKDFEGSPLLMPGVMMDQPGYLSPLGPPHILMPIQSKGLPSNGVLGNGGISPPPLQRDELKAALMQQVEYYFSKENLATDKYLVSQMDGDNFVPVTIVANFNQVKKLTTDLDLILEVVKESPSLQLDEQGEKIRAIPEKRCILILREIPQDTPQQDIMNLFSGDKCPSFISCEFAENSCWYVTFESEDDAQKAFAFLREEVRTFLGQPIRARIKGTTVQRSSGMPKTKPRVNYNPIQPMTRLPFYPQQSGMIPWTSPPNASAAALNGMPYFDRYFPAGNGFMPHPYGGPPGRFQYPQQINGGRNGPPDMPDRGRGLPGGRGRGERSFSPPLMNGGDMYPDRDRGPDRGGRPRDHSRDHYRSGSGGPERSRYPREDNIQKIPRLSKRQRPPPGGPAARDTGDRTTTEQPPPRLQQSLDLAPVNFPPLPTSEAGGTSPPNTTPTQLAESSDIKNLADIVKGRKPKDNAPPLTNTNHPPLPSTTTNGTSQNHEPEVSPVSSNQGTLPEATETSANPITTNATQTSTQSITTSSTPTQTQPLSIAAVVASNIPPVPRTVTSAHSTVSTSVTQATSSVTTAASVVASGVQSTVTTTSTVNSASNNNNGRQYQSKGPRGDSKGPYRGDRAYFNNSGKQGSARHNDKDNTQSRQNGVRNSQVSKDGRPAPPNNRRNRERDRKGGSNYRNGPPRPSPKPPKKHQPPQAPPPPPTPTNKQKDSPATKPVVDKTEDSIKSQTSSKSEKLSYAQMAQRKKTPISPIPPAPAKQDPQTENTDPPTKASSAPASPKGDRKNNKIGQSTKQGKGGKKGVQNSVEGAMIAPLPTVVSKSAPTSPSKESAGSSLSPKAKDE